MGSPQNSTETMDPRFKDMFENAEEVPDPVEGTVIGEIPRWLRGTYIRTGPGKFDLKGFSLNHWFDGYTIMYRFELTNDKVTYQQKYLQSLAYKKALTHNKPIMAEFATKCHPDPSKNVFARMVQTVVPGSENLTDNCNIGVFEMDGKVYVGTQSCHFYHVDAHHLETKEKINMSEIAGIDICGTHPLKDSEGNYYNIGTSLLGGIKYNIMKTEPVAAGSGDAIKKTTILSSIPSSWNLSFSYHHSFSMTENYIIFMEQPYLVSALKLATVFVKGRSFIDCADWDQNERNKFYIVNKVTGEIMKTKYVTTEPFFALHYINTYEEDGQIVIDVIGYRSAAILNKMYLDRLRRNEMSNEDPAQPQRYVLPIVKDFKNLPADKNLVTLKTTATAVKVKDSVILTSQNLGEPGCDMPIINPEYAQKKYRYFYVSGTLDPGHYRCAMGKVDIQTQEVKLWREHMGCAYVGEPVFVANPTCSDEDDGILIFPVTDLRKDHDDHLVILNAKNLEELARVNISVPIPPSLHGIFVASN